MRRHQFVRSDVRCLGRVILHKMVSPNIEHRPPFLGNELEKIVMPPMMIGGAFSCEN